MSILAKSLSRLYPEKVSKEKVDELLANGKITKEEYDEIINK